MTWQEKIRDQFTDLDHLISYLELDEDKKHRLLKSPPFILKLPMRLAAKIEKNSLNDPILKQFIPFKEENIKHADFSKDPVQDRHFQKEQRLLHKYEGRALILSTSACAMHCRYCFRKNFPYESQPSSFENELNYIRSTPSLSEIILSGGDPLSLPNSAFLRLINHLNKIPHIKRIRFHTRFPIGIPERIDEEFIHILNKSKAHIYFVLHVNHVKELDEDILEAVKKVPGPKLTQTVLLKGINDDSKTLKELFETLGNEGIIPYYLHQLDPVEGSSHFFVPKHKGKKLIEELRSCLSGYLVPQFVEEIAGEASKLPITSDRPF